jgi:hypothetical protein
MILICKVCNNYNKTFMGPFVINIFMAIPPISPCMQFMIGKNNKLVERLKFLDMCHIERFFFGKIYYVVGIQVNVNFLLV